MVLPVDLNCDMGEIEALHESGLQRRLMRFVSSVNISCGAHAGNERLIAATVQDAIRAGVRIGAHPGYPDPANFGRVSMAMSGEELAGEVERQLRDFAEVVGSRGGVVSHVKVHGALYNLAAESREVAEAVASGIGRWRSDVVVFGLAGSVMVEVFRSRGFRVWREGFADRVYESNGMLRKRSLPGAVISDPEEAGRQAVRLACSGGVDTVCIHGDHAGVENVAAAVRRSLEEIGSWNGVASKV